MTSIDSSILGTQGPIQSAPTVSAGTGQGTTATLIRDGTASDNRHQTIRVRVVNTHASNKLAVGFASGVKADESDAACGTIIMPEQSLEFSYRATLDLYLVASAASTSFQVSYEKVGA